MLLICIMNNDVLPFVFNLPFIVKASVSVIGCNSVKIKIIIIISAVVIINFLGVIII